MSTRPIEEEPSYRLGKALSIIEALLGTDPVSQTGELSRKFIKKNARKWAVKFLAEENERLNRTRIEVKTQC